MWAITTNNRHTSGAATATAPSLVAAAGVGVGIPIAPNSSSSSAACSRWAKSALFPLTSKPLPASSAFSSETFNKNTECRVQFRVQIQGNERSTVGVPVSSAAAAAEEWMKGGIGAGNCRESLSAQSMFIDSNRCVHHRPRTLGCSLSRYHMHTGTAVSFVPLLYTTATV